MSETVQVAAGVLVRDGRVLACQRRPNDAHPGKWEFPGGKRIPGESLERCLHRELAEELGIDATVGAEIWHNRHTYPNRTVELFFYVVTSFTGAIRNQNFADLRWVHVGDLSQLDFLEADRPLVERIDSGMLRLVDSTPAP